MQGGELAGAALFIGVFGFLAVGAWAGARFAERKAQARYALLTRLSEQPVESARLVLEFMRKDEEENERRKALKTRRDGMQAGLILIAVGTGLGWFLYMITAEHGMWTIGGMLVLLGAVLVIFGMSGKPPVAPANRT